MANTNGLIALREHLGVTGRALARAMDLNHMTEKNWETGSTTPTEESLVNACRTLVEKLEVEPDVIPKLVDYVKGVRSTLPWKARPEWKPGQDPSRASGRPVGARVVGGRMLRPDGTMPVAVPQRRIVQPQVAGTAALATQPEVEIGGVGGAEILGLKLKSQEIRRMIEALIKVGDIELAEKLLWQLWTNAGHDMLHNLKVNNFYTVTANGKKPFEEMIPKIIKLTEEHFGR